MGDECSQPQARPPAAPCPLPRVQGSWRATLLAHHPSYGRPDLTAAQLAPLTPVPGFSSLELYRQGTGSPFCAASAVVPSRVWLLAAPLPSNSVNPFVLACRRWYRCHVDLSNFVPQQLPAAAADAAAAAAGAIGTGSGGGSGSGSSIPYVPDASEMSADEFEARFDAPGQPVLLGGLAREWAGALGACGAERRCPGRQLLC